MKNNFLKDSYQVKVSQATAFSKAPAQATADKRDLCQLQGQRRKGETPDHPYTLHTLLSP